MKADLHMHTTYSDGKKTAEEVLKLASERGLDVAVPAPHPCPASPRQNQRRVWHPPRHLRQTQAERRQLGQTQAGEWQRHTGRCRMGHIAGRARVHAVLRLAGERARTEERYRPVTCSLALQRGEGEPNSLLV